MRITFAVSGSRAVGRRSTLGSSAARSSATPPSACLRAGAAGRAAAADGPARAAGGHPVSLRWGMQRNTGPSSGLPRRIRLSRLISTRVTRRVPANVPLLLPESSSTHASLSKRITACRHDTLMSDSAMSDAGSRPTR